jgi:alpha-galactosidase
MNRGSFLGLAGLAAFFLQGNVMGKPLKVYVLAGQSNMQSLAHKKTFAAIGEDPKTAPMLKVEKN